MELVKAIPLGAILSGVISLIIGSQGSHGGQMAIYMAEVVDYRFWWSWPLFFAGSGLAWGIMMLQR
ncbi:hypothetical protein HQR01_05565 [Erythrobacter mangrovi]|uniref:Uncharacterized protein n=2 Tax=Erythrobacter mangrovi TaxID=2739433 RepID=A0A7D3XBW4_9SPHN|nr:hypothetical protein HQR01_05565 [Erythrobacter mangrovi]